MRSREGGNGMSRHGQSEAALEVAIEREVDLLMREWRRLDGEQARVSAARAAVDARRHRIELLCLQWRGHRHRTSPAADTVPVTVRQPVWRAAAGILRRSRKPLWVPEIVRLLEARGYRFATDACATVHELLDRRDDGTFRRLPDGRFTLVEPGARRSC